MEHPEARLPLMAPKPAEGARCPFGGPDLSGYPPTSAKSWALPPDAVVSMQVCRSSTA